MKQQQEVLSLQDAINSGYCIVSRSGRLAARIDNQDWLQDSRMGSTFGASQQRLSSLADFYRRMFSKDVIVVPPSWLNKMPNSMSGPTNFKPKAKTT